MSRNIWDNLYLLGDKISQDYPQYKYPRIHIFLLGVITLELLYSIIITTGILVDNLQPDKLRINTKVLNHRGEGKVSYKLREGHYLFKKKCRCFSSRYHTETVIDTVIQIIYIYISKRIYIIMKCYKQVFTYNFF